MACEIVGAAVHILAERSKALYTDKRKLGGNLGSKTQKYICIVQSTKPATFEIALH